MTDLAPPHTVDHTHRAVTVTVPRKTVSLGPTTRFRWIPDPDKPGNFLLQQTWTLGSKTEWRNVPLEDKP